MSNFKNSLYQTSSSPKSLSCSFIAPINLETAPSTGAPSIGIWPLLICLSNLLKSLKVFFNSFTPILSPLGILKKVLISGYFLNKVFFCLSFNELTAADRDWETL